MKTLLTRKEFRDRVLARDNGCCVICKQPADEVHHIIERRLFTEESERGGYYVDNGSTLCSDHHLQAEQTILSPETIRSYAGIKQIVLPIKLEGYDSKFTKWGDVQLSSGQRLKGPLFKEEPVQKVLAQADLLGIYSKYIKYGRTPHFYWSEKLMNDDRMLPSTDVFKGKEVVVTTKLDGENTNMYSDHIHARSISSDNHPSRDWVKGLWGNIKHEIPEDWRICGENVYALHSLKYTNLETYFYVFSIWDEHNMCLSWDETLEWCKLLDLTPVPTIWRGIYDEEHIKTLYQPIWDGDPMEGYVVRNTSSYHYDDFSDNLAKFVSKSFQIGNKHWMQSQVIKNELRNSSI